MCTCFAATNPHCALLQMVVQGPGGGCRAGRRGGRGAQLGCRVCHWQHRWACSWQLQGCWRPEPRWELAQQAVGQSWQRLLCQGTAPELLDSTLTGLGSGLPTCRLKQLPPVRWLGVTAQLVPNLPVLALPYTPPIAPAPPAVRGEVHDVKEYGVLCDMQGHPDVVGLAAPHQVGGQYASACPA